MHKVAGGDVTVEENLMPHVDSSEDVVRTSYPHQSKGRKS